MSEHAEHTSGPWEWMKLGDSWVLWGAHSTRPIVLDLVRSGMYGAKPRLRDAELDLLIDFDPCHPDARLIAAAPLLLEACKAAKHVYEQGCVDRGWKDEPNWIDEAKDLLDAAIAAAKGES